MRRCTNRSVLGATGHDDLRRWRAVGASRPGLDGGTPAAEEGREVRANGPQALGSTVMAALDAIADWPVPAAAAAVVGPSGVLAGYGDTARLFRLASVTKPLVARAAQVAVEEGVLDLDTPAGPPGATVRHLLAHASGLSMQSAEIQAQPGTRRVYSNYGFQVLAEAIEEHSGIAFDRYLGEAVFRPLRMASARLEGGSAAAGFGGITSVEDLTVFAGDLLEPDDGVAPDARRGHQRSSSPGLDGVVPGFRMQRPNDWGTGLKSRTAESRTGREAGTPPRPRAFRPDRHLRLGGSVPRHRPRGPDRPGLRRLGEAAVAGAVRRGRVRVQLGLKRNRGLTGHNRHVRHNCIFRKHQVVGGRP